MFSVGALDMAALHGRKYQHFLFLYSEKGEVIAQNAEKNAEK
jgi:hypothetical protein